MINKLMHRLDELRFSRRFKVVTIGSFLAYIPYFLIWAICMEMVNKAGVNGGDSFTVLILDVLVFLILLLNIGCIIISGVLALSMLIVPPRRKLSICLLHFFLNVYPLLLILLLLNFNVEYILQFFLLPYRILT